MSTVTVHEYARATNYVSGESKGCYFSRGYTKQGGYDPENWFINYMSAIYQDDKSLPYCYLEIAPSVQRNYMLCHEDLFQSRVLTNAPKELVMAAMNCKNDKCNLPNFSFSSGHVCEKIHFYRNYLKKKTIIRYEYSDDYTRREVLHESEDCCVESTERCRLCVFFGINIHDYNTFKTNYYSRIMNFSAKKDCELLADIEHSCDGVFAQNLRRLEEERKRVWCVQS
ncbi:hypothetical protein [Nitratidesulfovibrio vulgaris]|uniref:Uncharacterized protein n=1 Tax=Nitratidesulfovibrio vulgaris (strain ATCC 29579 / DSM 644 / CCUG 34227 / NCIMB 8303 / VKM B-1760 / Hildenborough) TaxID=882 RepID=Q72A23_NITV2|nr:hypothetical protein [Nitratidesulfovibrio vulgaris]AAS96647.1 hypothetical protein DVU_2174 [Nitratidesulfovibrio vulgaris str. Hildenborough]ADP87172.1 hypothetical protein Deval_2025 [Nitratidesulfovibrio vulgaris RCH1]